MCIVATGLRSRLEQDRTAPAIWQPGRADVCRWGNAYHLIYTVQHASGWKYGDNYFFVDTLDAQNSEFQDFDTYGEWYANLSLGKITGRKIGAGIVSDIGVILGFNWARKPGIKKYLPGLRLSLDLGGFAFANLDFTAYIDDSDGVSSGGAPSETDSFMIDFNFMRPFKIGEASFSIEGHAEYIGGGGTSLAARSSHGFLRSPRCDGMRTSGLPWASNISSG